MKNKPFIIWAGVLLFLIIIVSSYNVGKDRKRLLSQAGKKIISMTRRPALFKSIRSIVFQKSGSCSGGLHRIPLSVFQGRRDIRTYSAQSSAPFLPYEKAEIVKGIESNTSNLKMSPDGKRIAGVTLSLSKASMQLFSPASGKNRNRQHLRQQ